MTEIITQIKQALTKITQGHWVYHSGRLRKEFPVKINEVQTASGETVVPWTGFDSSSVSKKEISHNAHFIANAPEWISSLLTTIESQKEEIEKLQSHLEWQAEETSQNLCIAEAFEKDNESLKAITELAVKGLEHYAEWIDWEDDSMGDKARSTLSEIEVLSQ